MDIRNGNLIEDNPTVEKPKRSIKIYFFLIAILALLATNAYYAIRYKKLGKEVEVLNSEKNQLDMEVDRIEAELNRVTGENIDLAVTFKTQHDSARALIQDLRDQLSANPTIDQADLLNTQQEIRRLRTIVAQYKTDLETLRSENDELRSERDVLKSSVDEINSRASELEVKNTALEEQIKAASDLKISNININALNVKKGNRESMETKARRVDRFQINFTLSNNPLAEVNKYNIYLRITEPSGNLITDGKFFNVNDQDLQYTAAYTIDFENNGKEYTTNWIPPNYDFQKGNYTVILYTTKSVMGRSVINLN